MRDNVPVDVNDTRVRSGCKVSVVTRDIDGRAPDAAVVVEPMQTVLCFQVPNVDLTAN